MSDCLERMILPALLSGRCSRIRLHTSPIRVACPLATKEEKFVEGRFQADFATSGNSGDEITR